MGFRGIDIRESGEKLVFRASLKDAAGAKIVAGTTNLRLYEVQADGTLKSYDFADNTFKATALTTEVQALTHRTGNNGGTNTGLWSVVLATLTGFTAGNIYIAAVTNSTATPETQEREFQFGSGVLADLQTVKTQAVTCAAAVTVLPNVGTAVAAPAVDVDGRVDVGGVMQSVVAFAGTHPLAADVYFFGGRGLGTGEETAGAPYWQLTVGTNNVYLWRRNADAKWVFGQNLGATPDNPLQSTAGDGGSMSPNNLTFEGGGTSGNVVATITMAAKIAAAVKADIAALLAAGPGAGVIVAPYNVVTATGAGIPGVLVTVFADQAMTQLRGSGRTNAAGNVTFLLAAGTYWVYSQLSGYTFAPNPESWTVA